MLSSNKIKYLVIIRKIVWISVIVFFVGLPTYVISVRYNVFNLFGTLPSYKSLENPEDENDLSSEVFSADGQSLGKYYRFNRSQIRYENISPTLENALLATEDIRFYDHSGIDFKSLFRVFFKTILQGESGAGGGSTISQQLAKNLFRTREKELQGSLYNLNINVLNKLISKTKEWIVAVQLERSFTKKEIMAMFLNTIFFGENSYGVKVAAHTFFNTEPDSLNYLQSAMLVGMLNKPTAYNPLRRPENALAKRTEVLFNLHKYGYLTREAFDTLKLQPLGLDHQIEDHNEGPAPYFRSVIRPFLINWCNENGYDLFESGLRIHTTLDSRLQTYAEKSMAEHMVFLQQLFEEHWDGRNPWIDEDGREMKDFVKNALRRTGHYKELVERYGEGNDSIDIVLNLPKQMKIFSWSGEIDTVMSPVDSVKYFKRFLQAGFMAMDPKNGHIRAWVGGINHRYFKYDHVMQGARQPGSTFKPILYCAAIDNGYSPCYTVADAPTSFQQPGQIPPVYTPKNYNKDFTGEIMTIRQGMARSKNSITAFMIKKLSPQTVVRYAEMLGIESPLDPVPALCLGVSDVTLYELLGAYSTFANRGVWIKPYFITRIEDKYGNIIQEFPPRTREALSEETAYLMTYMLRGATEEEGGTAIGLSHEVKMDNEVGAKTGTTQNGSDGWFIGLTKDLVAGCWVGGDDRSIRFRTTALGQGARMAMPIWDKFFQKIYADSTLGFEKGPFPRPTRPLSVEIDCRKYENPDFVEPDSLNMNMPKEDNLDAGDIM